MVNLHNDDSEGEHDTTPRREDEESMEGDAVSGDEDEEGEEGKFSSQDEDYLNRVTGPVIKTYGRRRARIALFGSDSDEED